MINANVVNLLKGIRAQEIVEEDVEQSYSHSKLMPILVSKDNFGLANSVFLRSSLMKSDLGKISSKSVGIGGRLNQSKSRNFSNSKSPISNRGVTAMDNSFS